MADIFVSYASNDRARVKPLVAALEQQGWSVWWDRTILAGKSWDEVIEAALANARCVVLIWTQESVHSEWVRTEAEEARRRGILIPVLLDDVQLPLAFRRVQAANLTDWRGSLPCAGFEDLARAISDVLSQSGSAPPALAISSLGAAKPVEVDAPSFGVKADGPPSRSSSFKPGVIAGGAIALALIAGLAGYFARGKPQAAPSPPASTSAGTSSADPTQTSPTQSSPPDASPVQPAAGVSQPGEQPHKRPDRRSKPDSEPAAPTEQPVNLTDQEKALAPAAAPPEAEATKTAKPQRIRVGGNVEQANLIRKVTPTYPQLAKQARVQGVVRFTAIIGKDGTVQNLQLVSGHPLLVDAAKDAVSQWQYKPTLLEGQPVEVVTEIDVNFTLTQ